LVAEAEDKEAKKEDTIWLNERKRSLKTLTRRHVRG